MCVICFLLLPGVCKRKIFKCMSQLLPESVARLSCISLALRLHAGLASFDSRVGRSFVVAFSGAATRTRVLVRKMSAWLL